MIRRNRQVLKLEPLEDRRLLATCNVTRLGDTGGGFGLRGDFRYCINKVNDLPGPDIIDFKVAGTINLNAALPVLATDMEIVGPGSDALTVRRGSDEDYRIFTVGFGVDVKISGLQVTGGHLPGGMGGGIYNGGNLTLIDTLVAYNAVADYDEQGGYGGGVYNTGSLTLVRAQILTNTAASYYESVGYGGGIYNTGTVSIHDSTVSLNTARGDWGAQGGGIANYSPGVMFIDRSTIASNSAFDAYEGHAEGGGIYNKGKLTVTDSTIFGNSAYAAKYSGWGGGVYNRGSLTVFNSTVSGNTAHYDYFLAGGAGGIDEKSGQLFVRNSTITNNHGTSGGISGAVTLLRNSVVANNTTWYDADGKDLKGSIISSGYNIIGNSLGGSGYARTDILNVDPLLGTLTNNGGPTSTHALLPGSPAIDAGTNHGAPEWDQRGPGFPRIVNGTIDIGAFEVQTTGAPLAISYRARRGSPDPAVFITADFETDDTNWRI